MKVDTFGGTVHVEWDPDAAATPLGHLAFFAEYLKVSGRFDALVADCPLHYTVSVRSSRGMGAVKRISHVEAKPHKVLSFCW